MLSSSLKRNCFPLPSLLNNSKIGSEPQTTSVATVMEAPSKIDQPFHWGNSRDPRWQHVSCRLPNLKPIPQKTGDFSHFAQLLQTIAPDRPQNANRFLGFGAPWGGGGSSAELWACAGLLPALRLVPARGAGPHDPGARRPNGRCRRATRRCRRCVVGGRLCSKNRWVSIPGCLVVFSHLPGKAIDSPYKDTCGRCSFRARRAVFNLGFLDPSRPGLGPKSERIFWQGISLDKLGLAQLFLVG